jgi:hypothetical protein
MHHPTPTVDMSHVLKWIGLSRPSSVHLCPEADLFIVKLTSSALQCGVGIFTAIPADPLISPAITILAYCLICLLNIFSLVIDEWQGRNRPFAG